MSVAIITPTYNASEYIMDTYKSLLVQDYTNWKWIVTDDCSTDGTIDILNDIAKKDSRVEIYKNSTNSGAAVSRNFSLSKVKEEYISFIDSDDIWYPGKLSGQLEFMKNKNIDFSFTAYQLLNGENQLLLKTVDTHIECVNYEDMLRKKATLGCSTVMIKRSSFNDFSMPLIRTGQDYALWLKLLKSCNFAYCYNKVLTGYRILPHSISRNKFKKAKRQWQIYREIECLSLMKSIECFCFYAWRAVFRK